ncbi:MAG: SH3 domain-containing protein [Candidatus Promineofilum sp.]|nr:SH3 domain-containing protein [Promineifilum sp.]
MNTSTIDRSGRLAFLLALLLLLIGIVLAVPAGIALAQDEPPFGEDVVTATTTANLRIRSAPSPDAETLAILPAGTVVGFTGLTDESGDWVQVDAADGPTGWVSAAFLSNVPDGLTVWSEDGAAEEEEVAADKPPFGEDVVTAMTTANLRIRSAPSLDGEMLAILPAGTVVGFTGLADQSGDWVQVDAADGPTGWVSAAFLSNVPDGLTVWSEDGAAEEEEVAADEPPFGEDVVTATTTANLRIRSAPRLDAEMLAILPAGTVVGFTGLTDESGDWVQVDAADGPTGWVSAAFLSNVPEGLTVWSEDEGD